MGRRKTSERDEETGVSKREYEYWTVCDGMMAKGHGRFFRLFFSGDSRHLCYVADCRPEECVVVDGVKGPEHEWVKMPEDYEEGGKLRYVVADGGEAWLVEVEWPEELDWTNGMTPVAAEKE